MNSPTASQSTGDFLDKEFRESLGPRYATFRAVFDLLQKRDRPVHIVETGCARQEGNISGDGLSTLLFARFVKEVTGGSVETIDISAENMDVCRRITAPYRGLLTYTVEDSVKALRRMSPERVRQTDLFYLDSMDIKRRHPKRSMKHHLKELEAIYANLSSQAIVMTDDNLGEGMAKGEYIREALLKRGWRLLNAAQDYQWIFVR